MLAVDTETRGLEYEDGVCSVFNGGVHHHYSSTGAPPAYVRLLSYYVHTPDVGCWYVSLRTSLRGYQRMSLRGVAVHASRVVLEAKLGRRLRAGEVARHTCDNPPCMRPDHIVPGTQVDNNVDRDSRGRVARCPDTGRYTSC